MAAPARRRSRYVVALDWDPRTLRVVHAYVGKRGVKIERLLSVGIPSDLDTNDPAQMGALIQRALTEQGIRTRYAIIDIPRDQVVLNTLSLPCAAPNELPGMVAIQMAKEMPFPIDDAVVDFAVPPDAADTPQASVVVAAIRREELDRYIETARVAGLRLERVGLRPYAGKVAICELLRDALPERVVFIDVRSVLTEIDVLRNGQLVFSRAASVAIPDSTEPPTSLSIVRDDEGASADDTSFDVDEAASILGTEAVANTLVLEVTRSIEAYRASDPGAQIDHIVIGGDTGVEEALVEAVQHRMKVTAELYNPARSVGWTPDEGAGATAFASSIGLVLGQVSAEQPHIDFLHPKEAVSQARKHLRSAPLVAAVVALFLVAGTVVGYDLKKDDWARLVEIEEQIAELEAHKRDYKKFVKFVDEIRDFEEKQRIWVDVLHDVLDNIPDTKELVISEISMTHRGDGRIVFKTRATELGTARAAKTRLEAFRRGGRKKPRFRVEIGNQSQAGGRSGSKYEYTQDLRILVLDDAPASKKTGKTKRRRS